MAQQHRKDNPSPHGLHPWVCSAGRGSWAARLVWSGERAISPVVFWKWFWCMDRAYPGMFRVPTYGDPMAMVGTLRRNLSERD